jgi:hypothetical protein
MATFSICSDLSTLSLLTGKLLSLKDSLLFFVFFSAIPNPVHRKKGRPNIMNLFVLDIKIATASSPEKGFLFGRNSK